MKRKRISKARRERLAKIATKAANKIARKTSWCQGSWATTIDGDRPIYDKYGCPLPSYKAAQAKAPDVDSTYFEANSPKAQKFCVEGAIYRAAGLLYGSKYVLGYKAACDVIDLLNHAVDHDPTSNFSSGQSLNDSNGDASRVRLVEHLRQVAKDLA